MRVTDLAGLALSALYQQKVRTGLTTLGVVIGTFVLALSLSIGQGVQEAAAHELHRHHQLRTIYVWPAYRSKAEDLPPAELAIKGRMSEAKRERLRQAIIRRWRGGPVQKPRRALTPAVLRDLTALEHVEGAVPLVRLNGEASLANQTEHALAVGVTEGYLPYRERIVAGGDFAADDERAVLVNEYLLYRLGVIDDDDVERVIGRTVRFECGRRTIIPSFSLLFLINSRQSRLTRSEEKALNRAIDQLPAALGRLDMPADEKAVLRKVLRKLDDQAPTVRVAEELTIRSVFRDATGDEQPPYVQAAAGNVDLYLPVQTAADLYERLPGAREEGFGQIIVRVDHEDNVQAVHDRIKDMGLELFSLAEVVEEVRLNVLLISFAMTFVALVALVVAALGITNTLLMSVLERTHEIGVMKAVGARDRHVQLLFLTEGALIGLFGALLGLLCSWLASSPGDRVAHTLAERQTHTHLEQALFVFPWWLTLGVPLFVSLLTMLAAVYPARRAARVNPITALRHE